jgi:protein O-GlcNAc transferase
VVPRDLLTAVATALARNEIDTARATFATWLTATGRSDSPWTVLLEFAIATHDWPAAERIATAWSRDPSAPSDEPSLWFLLALRASEASRFDDACRYWTEAARWQPESVDLWGNLAACELSRGQLDAAQIAADRARTLNPGFATAWDRLGLIAQARGDWSTALTHYDQAVALSPQTPGLWVNLASAALAGEQATRARAAATQAIHLDHTRAEAWFNRAAAADHLGLTEEAADCYQQAIRKHRQPPLAWRLQHASLLPAIYADEEAIAAARARYTSAWTALVNTGTRFDPVQLPCPIRFRLAYQGENDRELQALAARVIVPPVPGAAPRGSGGKRLRVGFVSKFLKEHTVGNLTEGLIRALPPERYETVVLHLGQATGPVADRLRSDCKHSGELPLAVEPVARAITEAALDVLVYPDIGMEPITLSLSYLRLAPRQLVLWGHPVTTGSPAIDGFVSSSFAEPVDARQHYTEPLLPLPLLPGILTRPTRIGPAPARTEFRLPETGRLYLCPQSLFKLHPQMDALLAGIISADPTGWIGLIEPPEPDWRRQLEARWQNADWTRRIVWTPRVDPQNFVRLLETASVLLDTRPFGGGYTTYQALALGVPVVTWPGEFLRGRVTHGCYLQMGVPEWSTHSAAEYIHRAVSWADQPALRPEVAHLAQQLFDRHDLLPAWETALRGRA